MLQASYGDKDPRLGMALHNVGAFFMAQRDYPQAQHYYGRALLVRSNLGGDPPMCMCDAGSTVLHRGATAGGAVCSGNAGNKA